jgi:hypothetical protein
MILFVFAGLVGYGVYSYYWASGTFSGDDTVTFASFNPQTYIDNDDFLGNGGTIRLDCSVSDSSSNYNHSDNICTGSLSISNEGDTDIDISVLDATSSYAFNRGNPGYPEYMGPANNMSISPGSPSFNWTTTTIEPGESETLEVSVYVEVNDGFDNSDAIHATESISDTSSSSYHDYYSVSVSFKAKAEQVH